MNLLYFMYINWPPSSGLTSRLKAFYVFPIGCDLQVGIPLLSLMWGWHRDTPKEQDSQHACVVCRPYDLPNEGYEVRTCSTVPFRGGMMCRGPLGPYP